MVKVTLSSLKMSHFRTHKLSIIQPSHEPIVIFGKNGVGKTNILEALSMFAPGRGLRRARFSDLALRPDLLGWKLEAKFKISDNLCEIVTSWDKTLGRKITIDGKPVSQSKLAQFIRILWITPMMDRIWLDGSVERRRFLDRIVSNLVPDHTEHIINYYKALKQRNRLLKEKVSDFNWYAVIENQMAVLAVEIDRARRDVISKIEDKQKNSNSTFPIAELNLIGTVCTSAEEYQVAFAESRKKDIYAGRTLLGPHLSDLSARYSSKDIDAKNCSTGEQKALLISVIIATAKIQLDIFQTPPILLFDEVSAHLDGERRCLLYDELCNLNLQVFLTGTDINIFRDLKGRAKYYEVVAKSGESICSPINTTAF